MSEGEEFIKDFLESEKIEFETEKKISYLNNDSKNYRIADFYLTNYKIYIEFYGQWNSENHKERYREKKLIYEKNRIPCIYIYPENLGIIEYVFHKRLIETFKKYKLKKELFKYRISEVWKRSSENIFLLIIGILILYFAYPWAKEENSSKLILGLIIIIYQVYKILKHLLQIFKFGPKNKRIYF